MGQGEQKPDVTVLEPQTGENGFLRRLLRTIGAAIVLAAYWMADRIEDVGKWAANFVRLLPARSARLGKTLLVGFVALATLIPTGIRVWRLGGREHFVPWMRARARAGGVRSIQVVLEFLDVFGMPEVFALAWRIVTGVSTLRGEEITTAAVILGPTALRYHDVRIAEGGVLRWVFQRNGNRAFTTFYTINLPQTGDHAREHVNIIMHELVHVYQYERAGSRYLAEALLAQHEEGYYYGGEGGLTHARSLGRRLRNFNREQQAQIVEDYYRSGVRSGPGSPYDSFIDDLREGRI